MKKTLIAFVLALALFAPSFSYAQEVPATVSDLDSLKVQLIQLLTQEVQMLQDQLTALQSQTADLSTKLDTLGSNPIGTTPIGGSTGGGVDVTVVAPESIGFQIYKTDFDGSLLTVVSNKPLDVSSTTVHQLHVDTQSQITVSLLNQSTINQNSCSSYDSDADASVINLAPSERNGFVERCGGYTTTMSISPSLNHGDYTVGVASSDSKGDLNFRLQF